MNKNAYNYGYESIMLKSANIFGDALTTMENSIRDDHYKTWLNNRVKDMQYMRHVMKTDPIRTGAVGGGIGALYGGARGLLQEPAEGENRLDNAVKKSLIYGALTGGLSGLGSYLVSRK